MNFRTLSIYAKIYMIVFGLIAVGVTMGYFQRKALNETLVGLKELGEVYYEMRGVANNILDSQRQMTIASRDVILETDPKKLEKITKVFEKANADQLEFLSKLEGLANPEQKKDDRRIPKKKRAVARFDR